MVSLAVVRIDETMSRRRLKIGDVMAEMGFVHLNASLGRALARGTQLQSNLILALEKWQAAYTPV